MIPVVSRLAAARGLSRVGSRRVRAGGVRLDLALSLGPRGALRRQREQRRWEGVASGARIEVYRMIWTEAAERLGLVLRELPDGLFEFDAPGGPMRFQRGFAPVDPPELIEAAGNKPRDYRRLTDAGVVVPEHLEFGRLNFSEARLFVADSPTACVVKPASDTGAGAGVTTHVGTATDLARAMLRASLAGDRFVVERQAHGSDHRILVLDGEILDVVRRSRPEVRGNGRASIGELIALENTRRLAGDPYERLRMLGTDLDSILALRSQGLALGERISDGRRIVVKGVVNQNAPAENETIEARLAPHLRDAALRAAHASGLRLAGVDLVTPGVDSRDAGYVVLEVNPHPGLHHHYGVADRARATRVAAPILRAAIDIRNERRGAAAR